MSIEHQNICSTMTLKHYKPNDIIVRQGDPGDSFFYILSGTVNIKLNITIDTGIKGEDKIVTIEKSIGVLKAGQTFGELALLYGTPRSATISSVTNSALIKIDKEPFDKYVKNIFERDGKTKSVSVELLAIETEDKENTSKRKEIKALIQELKKTNPQVESNIFRSVENVNIDTVVSYKKSGVVHNFLETYSEDKGSSN